jgi:hypothetical protein
MLGSVLQAVFHAKADRFPAVGLGEELRSDTAEIGGGALELEGTPGPSFCIPAPFD